MDWQIIHDWIFGLADQYGVNPVIFAILYVGAIPFFVLSLVWLVRTRRRHRPIHIPLLSVGATSIAAYVYLIIVGQNIPVWVYLVVITMTGYGLLVAARRVRTSAAS